MLSAGVHGSYEGSSLELLKGYSIANAADAAGFYTDIYLEALSEAHPKVRARVNPDANPYPNPKPNLNPSPNPDPNPNPDQVSFLHACPGFVRTRWGTEMPP